MNAHQKLNVKINTPNSKTIKVKIINFVNTSSKIEPALSILSKNDEILCKRLYPMSIEGYIFHDIFRNGQFHVLESVKV